MIDWTGAKNIVSETFFEDKISLHPLEEQEDEIGEVSETPGDSLGEFSCNVQYQPISKEQREQGIVTPQIGRVSTSKSLPIERGKRYYLKIVQARVEFNADEYWDVTDWTEGQISTVLMIKRREVV